MKLLFDQNLSPGLTESLKELFDGSIHVQEVNLDKSDDLTVWEYAKSNRFTIITKDGDFSNIVSLYGFPPKVIWIKKGNCTTQQIKLLIIKHLAIIKDFLKDLQNGILTIH